MYIVMPLVLGLRGFCDHRRVDTQIYQGALSNRCTSSYGYSLLTATGEYVVIEGRLLTANCFSNNWSFGPFLLLLLLLFLAYFILFWAFF
jgi:hypothetical protein